MVDTPKKPSWLSTEAESIKAWGLAHWTYLLTFGAGFLMALFLCLAT